jgi:catechol 2,3-dioxygenase-like lactoylglutathione lyase family enzyme
MRLSQVRLLVDDFRAMFRFYVGALGLEPTWGDENGQYAEFEVGGATRLAIGERRVMAQAVPVAGGDSGDSVVLVLEVEDVDEVSDRLRGEGAELVTEPADREAWGVRVFHVRDPEGNLIEVSKPLRS